MYNITKTKPSKYRLSQNKLNAIFSAVKEAPAYSNLDFIEKCEEFVEFISEKMNWEFTKGGAENGKKT
jgi:hypothetical protein